MTEPSDVPEVTQRSMTDFVSKFAELTKRLSEVIAGLPEGKQREIVALFTELHGEHAALIRAVGSLHSWYLKWGVQLLEAHVAVSTANKDNMTARAAFFELLTGELASKANSFEGGEVEQLQALRTAVFATLGACAGANVSLIEADKSIATLSGNPALFTAAQRALRDVFDTNGLWPTKPEPEQGV